MRVDDPPIDQAAQAFASLRQEVAALRDLVAALPDTAPTLAVMARALTRMEQHPALQLTPQGHAQQLRAAQEAARREGEPAFDKAVQQVNVTVGELAWIVEQARTARRQNWRLLQVGAAALIGGAVLWVALSGPTARSLPAGGHVPERMAAATLANSRWEGGEKMMQSANPKGWAQMMDDLYLVKANREAINRCRDEPKCGVPLTSASSSGQSYTRTGLARACTNEFGRTSAGHVTRPSHLGHLAALPRACIR